MTKFSVWLRKRRHFYLFSILAFGIPSWFLEIWFTWDYARGALWVAFLAAVSLGASLVWATVMWYFFQWYFPFMRTEREDDTG